MKNKQQCPYCEKELNEQNYLCPTCDTPLESIWLSAGMAREYLKKGYVMYSQGNAMAALELANAAVTLDQRLVQAHLLLGKIYYDIGLKTFASHYWACAGELQPDDEDIKKLIKQCRAKKNK